MFSLESWPLLSPFDPATDFHEGCDGDIGWVPSPASDGAPARNRHIQVATCGYTRRPEMVGAWVASLSSTLTVDLYASVGVQGMLPAAQTR